jgi:hypothetical protein
MKILIFSTGLKRSSNLSFIKIIPVSGELIYVDRQTNSRYDNNKSLFLQFFLST